MSILFLMELLDNDQCLYRISNQVFNLFVKNYDNEPDDYHIMKSAK